MALAPLAKRQRILAAAGFDRVFAARQRVRRGPVVVAWMREAEPAEAHAAAARGQTGAQPPRGSIPSVARLGIAVSKRHAHSAALRNRIKRHIREVFRHHTLAGLPIACVVHLGESVSTQTIPAAVWRQWITEALDLVVTKAKL